MDAGLLVRLHPAGPWRFGASSGERDRLDRLYRSDALYSAVTLAMAELGLLEAWLEATAAPATPQVRLTSCFPWQEGILFVTPPRSHWPAAAVKLRTKGADFIPASLAGALLEGAPFHEDDWIVDGWSRCLLPAARPASAGGPFRDSLRSFAAVDRRDPARIAPHRAACIEFAPNAGLWCFAAFSDPEAQTRWSVPLEGAFRLRSKDDDPRIAMVLSEQSFRDLTLRLKFRILKGNSGVFVRTDPATLAAYEVEVDAEARTGGFWETGPNGRKWVTGPEDNAVVHPGEWNELTASLHGHRVVFHINGVRTVELPDDIQGRLEGVIGLQAHGAKRPTEVWFKDIEVLEPVR